LSSISFFIQNAALCTAIKHIKLYYSAVSIAYLGLPDVNL
jgi:hypothetical protein